MIYKFIRNTLLLSVSILVICVFTGCSKRPDPASPYSPDNYLAASTPISFDIDTLESVPLDQMTTLSVPTYITKIDDLYFIVDCYNNQVIYHDNLNDPLPSWNIASNDLSLPHSVASDGTVYLIDDTERHRVLVMEKGLNSNNQPIFLPTQEFLDIGTRPHYILYDDYTDTFYVWSSLSGEMYLFRRAENTTDVYLTNILSVPELNGVYVRSFTILEDRIYFVSGNSNILECDLYSFEVINRYPVPDSMAGMVQLTKIQDYYYITVSTDITGNQDYATLLRVKDLKDLAGGDYEDIYRYFIGGGTPYCITQIDDTYFLTEHRLPGHSIWSFTVENNEIGNVTEIY